MTTAERGHLIRARAKKQVATTCRGQGMAKAQGKAPEHPKRVRYVELPKASGRGFVSCGPLIPRAMPAWVAIPDDTPRATVRTKRNQGRSALGRIAEQLPRKLPRVL